MDWLDFSAGLSVGFLLIQLLLICYVLKEKKSKDLDDRTNDTIKEIFKEIDKGLCDGGSWCVLNPNKLIELKKKFGVD